MGPSATTDRDGPTGKLFDTGDAMPRHQVRFSGDAGGAEHGDVLAPVRLADQVLGVLDDDFARVVEQRRLVLLGGLDVEHLHVDVVAPRHLPDTEDNRGPIVVAVGEANLVHEGRAYGRAGGFVNSRLGSREPGWYRRWR